MTRYRMAVAYDGTAYAGWQVQPNAVTIQAKLESALREITGETTKVHGSGRTDQGVHARRQVAHFDLAGSPPKKALISGLNALLPPDIRVSSVQRTDPGFHARKSAVNKEYRYFIWNAEVVPPFICRYRTHIRRPLDAVLMQQAAALLTGRHDFSAFTANSKRHDENRVRSLHALEVRKSGSEMTIIARGEGFLYKMVRSLAGFLVKVGEGALPPGDALSILQSRVRTARVPTAPPEGLFLWNVKY